MRRDENYRRNAFRTSCTQHTKAIHLRHLNVEEQQIGCKLFKSDQCVSPVSALTDDFHVLVRRKQLADTAPGQWFIVGNQEANLVHLTVSNMPRSFSDALMIR